MKIIEYGTIKPDIIKCSHCDATLEYTPRDIREKYLGSYLFRLLTCPVCKGNIVILKKEGAKWVR